MSEENVKVVRDALDAFGAADVDRLLHFMDPEIKFEPHLAQLEGTYRGHDGVRDFMSDAFEAPDDSVDRTDRDVRDLGDRVLTSGTFYIRGAGSGIEYEAPFAILARVREGRIVHMKDYVNEAEALEAAGLSE
jgi:ketosteroid isomerase-like protein